MQQELDRFTLPITLFAILSAFPATVAASTASSTIAQLPNVQMNAAKVDASGNIYLVGQTTGPTTTSAASGAAYVAKLTAGGTVLYATSIGGSGSSTSAATALDIDSTGAVYVAGTTTASDFPVSAGAAQSSGSTAFAVKLDTKGNIVYSALIGGNATTTPSSVVVNSKGELIVSGQSITGPASARVLSLFLLKLSADGTKVTAGPPNVGGLLAIDAQDNIYIAGVPPLESAEPAPTPGAFQGTPKVYYCGCPFLSFPCGGDQFVASLSGDLSHTRFLTYVTAQYGAVPAYIAVDAHGNVLIAGTTKAPGYPTTPNSYQPNYTAANGTVETCGPPIPLEFTSASGYVTLVKADGSGLIFSTFFSGSKSDSISFAALTSAGIYLAGQAGSVDLPGFDGDVPSACVPVVFVTRMTADGSAISASRTAPGNPLAYDSSNGTLLLASGNNLLRFDPSQATPIGCVLDAADLSPVTAVAPGELLTMFGRFLYFESDPFGVAITPMNGSFPVQSQGIGIVANQTPAPLLYVSEQQINFQLPYEIAGSPQTSVTLTYSDVNGNSVSASTMFQVAASNPVAFLSKPANLTFPMAINSPVVLNSDGTVNSPGNPAAANSVVTIFLDGLGLVSPLPVTGKVNPVSPTPLNVTLAVTPRCDGSECFPAPTFISASPLPGSISGVTQVQLRAPASAASEVIFSLTAGSTTVRDMNLSLWVN